MSIQTWLFTLLSLFFSLFSLLASLAAARSGKVQTLLQSLFLVLSLLLLWFLLLHFLPFCHRTISLLSSLFSLLSLLLDPGKCKPCCSSVVHYVLKGFSASFCALPSCFSEPDLFLYFPPFCHRTISLLSSLFSFPSSLAVAFFPDPTSRLSLRSVHQAIDGAPHCFVPWPHPDPHPHGVFSFKCLRFYLCSIS